MIKPGIDPIVPKMIALDSICTPIIPMAIMAQSIAEIFVVSTNDSVTASFDDDGKVSSLAGIQMHEDGHYWEGYSSSTFRCEPCYRSSKNHDEGKLPMVLVKRKPVETYSSE